MPRFKVGDYIVGNHINTYNMTCKGSYWYVTKIHNDRGDTILVNETNVYNRAEGYYVECKYFDMVKPKIESFELLESGDYIIK